MRLNSSLLLQQCRIVPNKGSLKLKGLPSRTTVFIVKYMAEKNRQINLQIQTNPIIRLLNKPYGNDVTLREQNKS